MNAERLIELYDRVSEAPDAFPRLRRFILDLAVRGKLVEQDPSDEPAQALFHEIVSAHKRSEKSKKTRPEVKNLEGPFELPASWIWVGATFPAASVSDQGKKVKTKDVLESGVYPVVDQGKVLVRGYCDDPDKVIRVEGPIIVFGDHTRETKLIDFDFVVGADGVKLLQPVAVDPHYYYLALTWLPLEARGYGRHFKLLRESKIPLPPLVEQSRIVGKVEELMALCDSLEAEREKREATRDRLTTASLSRLTATDINEKQFKAHADFAIKVLPELTTRPEQIKALRQTILGLAVRGKLVEQDPNDEPASFALARIAQSKKGLADASTRKRKLVAPAELTQIIHALPVGWSSAAISELVRVINGRAYKQSELLESGTPVLRVGNLFTSKHWYYSDLELEGDKYCDNGDLIYAWSASFGPFFWDGPRAIFHYHIWKLSLFSEIDLCKRFLYYFLLQKTELIKGSGHGISMVHMTKEKMEQIMVPFPPLTEQRRIVARVDELMTLCDGLERDLISGQKIRTNLLEALLSGALEPTIRKAA